MSEFQMPLASIPNSKIYITEATMKKILAENKSNKKGFSSMFTNVICDQSILDTTCDSITHKNIPGTTFAPPKKDNFRYHIQKPHMNANELNQRVHKMPMDKKIIRTTIMPKIKPEEPNIDYGLQLAPVNSVKQHRSFSYKDRPYYKEMQNLLKQSRQKLDPPAELLGKSYDGIFMQPGTTNEWVETEIQKGNLTNIKIELEKVLEKCSPKKQLPINESENQNNHYKPSFMFVEDDRDRCGKQIYPISLPQPRPGPGWYDPDITSLNYRITKIQERNTQKRLVQLWQQQF